MNPRKLQQMMQQMGIEVTDIEATEVQITTADGEVLRFDAPEVTQMDAQGQRTFQIIGDPETIEGSAADDSEASAPAIPADDIAIVAEQAGVDEEAAREALEAEDGDLAAAVARLS